MNERDFTIVHEHIHGREITCFPEGLQVMPKENAPVRMTQEQITAMIEEANRANNEQPCGECGCTEDVTKNVYLDGSKEPFFLCRECYFSGLGPFGEEG